jgi:peptide chain release factor 1
MENEIADLFDKIELVAENYDSIINKIALDKRCIIPEKLIECGREISELDKLVEFARKYHMVNEEIKALDPKIKNEKNFDLRNILKDEWQAKLSQKNDLKNKIDNFLTPATTYDNKNIIVEISSSYKGDGVAGILKDVFGMYKGYLEKLGIKFEILKEELDSRGTSMIIFEIFSGNAFKIMKYEAGKHKIKSYKNRKDELFIDISVLPAVQENEMVIKKDDLKIEVFHSKGHGGQSVNTTDSAVRITHLPSGIVVSCQDERSQFQNKEKAMKILRARLSEKTLKKQEELINEEKRDQLGPGRQYQWLRTYDFKLNKIMDNRVGAIPESLNFVIDGNFDMLLNILKRNEEEKKLESLVNFTAFS